MVGKRGDFVVASLKPDKTYLHFKGIFVEQDSAALSGVEI